MVQSSQSDWVESQLEKERLRAQHNAATPQNPQVPSVLYKSDKL